MQILEALFFNAVWLMNGNQLESTTELFKPDSFARLACLQHTKATECECGLDITTGLAIALPPTYNDVDADIEKKETIQITIAQFQPHFRPSRSLNYSLTSCWGFVPSLVNVSAFHTQSCQDPVLNT